METMTAFVTIKNMIRVYEFTMFVSQVFGLWHERFDGDGDGDFSHWIWVAWIALDRTKKLVTKVCLRLYLHLKTFSDYNFCFYLLINNYEKYHLFLFMKSISKPQVKDAIFEEESSTSPKIKRNSTHYHLFFLSICYVTYH